MDSSALTTRLARVDACLFGTAQPLTASRGGRAELKLHHPTPREIALRFDKPWEGNASGYATVFQDGDNYQSYGLFETKSNTPGLPDEISLHFNEGSWRDDQHRLRRYTIRLD